MKKTMISFQYRWIGLIFICISLLVVSMNDTILNVSLPVIAKALNASTKDLQWVGDAYILVFASLLLTMGTLSDRFGRKLFLQIGVILFSVFSIVAAVSTSIQLVIFARALQGIGGAIIMPSTLSMISTVFKESKEKAKAIAIWNAMFGLGIGIGPLIGGGLLEVPWLDWRSVFVINIPFAVVALIGVSLFLPESKDKLSKKPDIPGVVLSSCGLFFLVFAIIEAGERGWGNGFVFWGLIAAVFCIGMFLWWESKTKNAMLPLAFFKNRTFSGANITLMMSLFSIMGLMFFLPQYFQGVQNLSPVQTAIRLVPQGIISILVSANSHQVITRFGIKKSVTFGFLFGAIGLFFLYWVLSINTSYWLILIGIALCFLGMDTAMPASTIAIMEAVPESKAGIGSAMNEMTGQIGSALGIAVMGSTLNSAYLRKTGEMQITIGTELYEIVSNGIFSAQRALQINTLPSLEALDKIVKQAFVYGLKETFLTSVVILVFFGIFIYFFLPNVINKINEDF
ncbi:MAG: MFS transporter [Anaerolineaceae bacterium]|nr:MFS transporter [Anaerolineaceae bacterium]